MKEIRLTTIITITIIIILLIDGSVGNIYAKRIETNEVEFTKGIGVINDVTVDGDITNLTSLAFETNNTGLGRIIFPSSTSSNNGIRFGNNLLLYSASPNLEPAGLLYLLGGFWTSSAVYSPFYYGILNGDYRSRLWNTDTSKFIWYDNSANFWLTLTNNASTITMGTGSSSSTSTNPLAIGAGTNLLTLGQGGPVIVTGAVEVDGTLYTSGRVQIGTTTNIAPLSYPPPSLYVESSQNRSAHFVSTSVLSTVSGAGMFAYNTGMSAAPDQRLGYYIIGAIGSNAIGAKQAYNSIALAGYSEGAWSTSSTPSYMVFQTAPTNSTGRSDRMRITSMGRVGIGTNSPYSLLDVNGDTTIRSNLTVYGSITGTTCIAIGTNNSGMGKIILPASTSTNDGIRFGETPIWRNASQQITIGDVGMGIVNAGYMYSISGYYSSLDQDMKMRLYGTTSSRKWVWYDKDSAALLSLTNDGSTVTLNTGLSAASSTNALTIGAGTNLLTLGQGGLISLVGTVMLYYADSLNYNYMCSSSNFWYRVGVSNGVAYTNTTILY